MLLLSHLWSLAICRLSVTVVKSWQVGGLQQIQSKIYVDRHKICNPPHNTEGENQSQRTNPLLVKIYCKVTMIKKVCFCFKIRQ